ncbi:GNAT family N-acetyltransferase [Cyclobacterium jeungdonense]|uniref:GNAT family N-acetyltransferase n=1 Tax=Cyclobacterium jeungdonense TaxID=708087 RepID=A0ABT8C1W8_9BACT|nr:GNAT family N-acetyltransferase [Cyclobacterium jeungdonense]MDN3686480.1 GNAT family N-acetyltransferase [Cyclobacterium jeungdonense]
MDSEIYIRQMLPDDLDVAMALKKTEGWNQTREDWQLFLKQQPQFCLVAVIENKPVGTVTAIAYQNRLAWIGMMLVDRKYRRKGISKMLMREILHRLEGISTIKLDATPEGQFVYQQLGFKKEYSLWRFVRKAIHSLQESDRDAGVSRVSISDLPELEKLDAPVFGASREKVLGHLLLTFSEGALMLKEAGELKGYILSRKGSNYTQLGPLVAKDEAIARRLINQALTHFNDQALVLDVAANRQELIPWLENQGFEQRRELIRMYFQTNRYPGIPEKYYLIAGPELG